MRSVLMTTLVALALTTTAAADPCGMVPPAWIADGPGQPAIQRTGVQTTYVFHKDGIESMVLRPGFSGSVEQFGMLIPFPSPPEIRKVGDEVHTQMAAAVDQPIMQVYMQQMQYRMSSAREEMSDAPTMVADTAVKKDVVRVLSQEAVGMYEVAVLDAGSAKALERWMTENDFRFPDGMEDTIEEYVEEGWVFTAVKANVGAAETLNPSPGLRKVDRGLGEGERFDGYVQAMGFRFLSDEPVVPMRLATFNGTDTHNLVYFLAEEPLKIRGMSADLVVRQVPGDQVQANLSELLPLQVSGGRLSRAERDALAPQRNPDPFVAQARDVIASDLLAARTQTLSHAFEEDEKELLRVSEALGLRGADIDRLHHDAISRSTSDATEGQLGSLAGMTLTVVEGNLPIDHLREFNLTFTPYQMDLAANDRNSWSRAPAGPVAYVY